MNIKTTKYTYVHTHLWIAFDDDTYDGAEDGNNTTGSGRTEQEAINDLMEQLNELNK